MYKQITPTFQTIAPIKECDITNEDIMSYIKNEDFMKKCQVLTSVLLENKIPLDKIMVLVKKYQKCYIKLHKEDDIMLESFTPSNFIHAL